MFKSYKNNFSDNQGGSGVWSGGISHQREAVCRGKILRGGIRNGNCAVYAALK
jgi:hypothetical protein